MRKISNFFLNLIVKLSFVLYSFRDFFSPIFAISFQLQSLRFRGSMPHPFWHTPFFDMIIGVRAILYILRLQRFQWANSPTTLSLWMSRTTRMLAIFAFRWVSATLSLLSQEMIAADPYIQYVNMRVSSHTPVALIHYLITIWANSDVFLYLSIPTSFQYNLALICKWYCVFL